MLHFQKKYSVLGLTLPDFELSPFSPKDDANVGPLALPILAQLVSFATFSFGHHFFCFYSSS